MSPAYHHRKPPHAAAATASRTKPLSARLATREPPEAPPEAPPPEGPPTQVATPADEAPRVGPARARPEGRSPVAPAAAAPPMRPEHWAAFAVILVVALALRLRDALSSTILGAEDPYLHMERTWGLVQNGGVSDYPPGLMILLFPFTLLGPDAFYTVARFLPAFLGTGAVAATFFLCRPYLPPVGALGASLLTATMSEHIFRTNLLTPTALDLMLIPILLLAVLRAFEGRRWGLWTTGAMGVYFVLVHPWAFPLVAAPVLLFSVVVLAFSKERRRWAAPAAAGGFVAFGVVVSLLPVWSPTTLLMDHAAPRLARLAADPATVLPLPPFVDPVHMLGWPAVLLGAVGAVLAARRRSRFGLLALLWVALMLPLMLVDWFGIWYIPHRTVAYLAVGLAMLGGFAVAETVRLVQDARPRAARAAGPVALAVLLVLAVPGAMATQSWYRIYDEDDFAAWESLDQRDRPYVMAGTWQLRAGYRAVTAGPAVYNPAFFQDEVVRAYELQLHPDLIVLVDNRTEENGLPTQFLQSWTLEGQWGDVRAYSPP